jgi:hypothetical protein
VLFETRMERCFSRGAEKHLTTGDDYRQRQQEQPEEPQRKLREHRHRYMTIVEVWRFHALAAVAGELVRLGEYPLELGN